MSVLARPARRSATADAATTRCGRCASMFRAHLTAWACPVCGWETDRPQSTGVRRWLDEPGNRIVALVAGATLANAVLLLALAMAVSRSS